MSYQKPHRKTEIRDILRLRKQGFTLDEIAEIQNVDRSAIIQRLRLAKKKGIYNGKVGLQIPKKPTFKPQDDDFGYDNYYEQAKNSKMIGRPLTREEWVNIWREEKKPQPQETTVPFPRAEITETPFKAEKQFKCSKCMKIIDRIEDTKFKRSELKQWLLDQGYTHICVNCGIAYTHNIEKEEPSEDFWEKSKRELACPECKKKDELAYDPIHYVFLCVRCRLFFQIKMKR